MRWKISCPCWPPTNMARACHVCSTSVMRERLPELFHPLPGMERYDGCMLVPDETTDEGLGERDVRKRDLPEFALIVDGKRDTLTHDELLRASVTFELAEDGKLTLLPYGGNNQESRSPHWRHPVEMMDNFLSGYSIMSFHVATVSTENSSFKHTHLHSHNHLYSHAHLYSHTRSCEAPLVFRGNQKRKNQTPG